VTKELPHRRKGLPLNQSILWVPAGAAAAPAGEPYLVFLHQRALNALHDHLRTSPDKGILGFLLGHLYEDPASSQRFAVIELVMRLTVAIYGDKTTVVVSRVWDKMQEELTRSGAQLLGWYHSHPPEGIELAAGDLETHATYFGQPWQTALVVAAGADGPTAGLYRPNREGLAGGTVLPFYELLDPRSVTPEGKKRSSVRWGNYKPLRPPAGVTTGRSGPVPAVSADAAPATLSFKPSATPAAKPAGTAPPPSPKPAPAPAPQPPPLPPPPPMRPPPTLASQQVPVGFVDKPPAVTPSGKRAAVPEEPALAPRRRISKPSPRFVMSEGPKEPSRAGLVVGIIAFVVIAAAAVWYFKFGPGSQGPGIEVPPPPAAPAAVDSPPRGDSASARDSVAGGAADSAGSPAPAAAATTPLAAPVTQAPPAAPREVAPLATLKLDRLSDSLAGAVQSYQERARMYTAGRADCTILGRGLVGVESGWAAYNAEKKTLTLQLDATRSQRDLTLYSSVDTVEAHFDRSGCRRP
jgi:proteasome lid subunit RPN8/RPN11